MQSNSTGKPTTTTQGAVLAQRRKKGMKELEVWYHKRDTNQSFFQDHLSYSVHSLKTCNNV